MPAPKAKWSKVFPLTYFCPYHCLHYPFVAWNSQEFLGNARKIPGLGKVEAKHKNLVQGMYTYMYNLGFNFGFLSYSSFLEK